MYMVFILRNRPHLHTMPLNNRLSKISFIIGTEKWNVAQTTYIYYITYSKGLVY